MDKYISNIYLNGVYHELDIYWNKTDFKKYNGIYWH